MVLEKIESAAALYHRLVLVVGPSGSGKTAVLLKIAEQTGAPLLNVNLRLSERLLDLPERQRALEVGSVLEDLLGTEQSVVLLDNTEILFHVSLKQDPLRLLQRLSRNRAVVASWNGTVSGGYLVYATPEHPEYRRYPARDLVVVSAEAAA